MCILVSGGTTEITGADIGGVSGTGSSATVTPPDADLASSELTTTIAVWVLDQYETDRTSGNGWYITRRSPSERTILPRIAPRFGRDACGGESSQERLPTPDQLATDESPVFEAVLEINYALYGYGKIILRDAAGDPM
jgi:hypothetical protein